MSQREPWKTGIGCLGMLGCVLGLGCQVQKAAAPLDGTFCMAPTTIEDPHITREECWINGDGTGRTVIVTIDRGRPDSEIWVIEEAVPPQSLLTTAQTVPDPEVPLKGAVLSDRSLLSRSKATVQINGFTFDCAWYPPLPIPRKPYCYFTSIPELAKSSVYESTHMLSENHVSSYGPERLMAFGPRGDAKIPIGLNPLGGVVGPTSRPWYNAVGSVWPAKLANLACGDEALWREFVPNDAGYNNAPDAGPYVNVGPDDFTVIGYNEGSIVMLHASATTGKELCAFLESRSILNAMIMDGGGAAGMLINTDTWFERIGALDYVDVGVLGVFLERRIPYRLGLVTLGGEFVKNGNFEVPNLKALASGTPTGRHSFAGSQVPRLLGWSAGAASVYNMAQYGEHSQQVVPGRGGQVAAIRPRGLSTDFLSQWLDGAPANRYCMLHFYHGYRMPEGCSAESSELWVTVEDDQGNQLTRSIYWSNATPGDTLTKEEWLRFRTPRVGRTLLKFRAMDPSTIALAAEGNALPLPPAQGNCEVLLDDVSVRCAE
jgi:hypothetical protein